MTTLTLRHRATHTALFIQDDTFHVTRITKSNEMVSCMVDNLTDARIEFDRQIKIAQGK